MIERAIFHAVDALHLALDTLTDHGRHPEDAYIALAAVIVVAGLYLGWF